LTEIHNFAIKETQKAEKRTMNRAKKNATNPTGEKLSLC
jgi:hypothetical protein